MEYKKENIKMQNIENEVNNIFFYINKGKRPNFRRVR